jgi:hypothetical protein
MQTGQEKRNILSADNEQKKKGDEAVTMAVLQAVVKIMKKCNNVIQRNIM